MLPPAKCSDIFETRLQPQIVSGERLSMLQDNGSGGRGEHVRFGWPYDHGHYDVTAKEAPKCTKFSKMASSPLADTTFWGRFLLSFQFQMVLYLDLKEWLSFFFL